MILICLALPGGFGKSCDAALAAVAEAAGYRASAHSWPSYAQMFGFAPHLPVLEQAALNLIAGPHMHIVMGVRQPDEWLLSALADTGARFVVALDDPCIAALQVATETGADPGLITRAVANSCPLLMRFAAMPGALTLHAALAHKDAGQLVTAIDGHFGFGLDEQRRAAVASALSQPDPAANRQEAPALSEAARRTMEAALSGYAEQFARGGSLGRIVWRRELFILFDDGSKRATGIVNVAGVPRTLIYGPYIQLPPGRWTARVTLGFSGEAVGSTFLIDAFADTRQLGHIVVEPQTSGAYTADLEFSLDQPSVNGVEIRVLVTSGNPRGQMALGPVVLQPVAIGWPAAIAGSEDFEQVLEL